MHRTQVGKLIRAKNINCSKDLRSSGDLHSGELGPTDLTVGYRAVPNHSCAGHVMAACWKVSSPCQHQRHVGSGSCPRGSLWAAR